MVLVKRFVLVIVRVEGITKVLVTGILLVIVRVVSVVLTQVDVTNLLDVTKIVTVTVHAGSARGKSKASNSR